MPNIWANKQTGEVKESIDRLYLLMAGVIIVLLVGFATGFIAIGSWMTTSNAERQATYQSLRDQVKASNDKVDALTEQLQRSNDLKVTPAQ